MWRKIVKWPYIPQIREEDITELRNWENMWTRSWSDKPITWKHYRKQLLALNLGVINKYINLKAVGIYKGGKKGLWKKHKNDAYRQMEYPLISWIVYIRKEMIEAFGNFRFGLTQPSPYEIRMRVFKAEIKNINNIKENHMVA